MTARGHVLPRLIGAGLLALLLTSCAELTQVLPDSGPPLTTASDPGIKAAGESSNAVDNDRRAQNAVNKAIETRNPNGVDEAIKLRPQDPTYLLSKYVLQAALEETRDSSLVARALGLIITQYPHLSRADQLQLAYIHLLDALITTNKFPKDSVPWKRLREGYCDTLAEYRLLLGSERADLLYSNEGCPANAGGR